MEETPIPETSYPCIFTEEWLQDINEGRRGTLLSRCLLCTDQGVIKLPWAEIAIPEFLDKPKIMPTYREAPPERKQISVPSHFNSSTLPVEAIFHPAKDRMSASFRTVDCAFKNEHERQIPKSCSKPLIKPVGWVSPNTWDNRETYQEIEGDYVDLVDIVKEKEFMDKQRDSQTNTPNSVLFKPVRPPPPVPLGNSAHCACTLQYAEKPCTLCSQRKPGQELTDQDLKCRYRDSYVSALRNPVPFEKGGADHLAALKEVSLCEEGELRSKDTLVSQGEGLESFCNHCNKPFSNELRQYRQCCQAMQENISKHPASFLPEKVMREPAVVWKSTPGLSHSQKVQMKLISQQSDPDAGVLPGSHVFSENCDVKPQQPAEAVKPSGKHQVKARSLSTVSETSKGSPALYRLNKRSHSDASPETITGMMQLKTGELLDQMSQKLERQKCPRKGTQTTYRMLLLQSYIASFFPPTHSMYIIVPEHMQPYIMVCDSIPEELLSISTKHTD